MNIVWKGSPNFDKGRQGAKIYRVVMHWIVGDLPAADAQFAKSTSKVSAHYAVGTSEIHQYVKEEDTAWHAGVYAMNLRSIGIEHRGGPDLPIDEGTYKNSAELLKEICKRHGIALDREHIILHREVKATACPGNLDVDKIIEMAKGNPCDELEKKVKGLEETLLGVRKSRDEWKNKYNELLDSSMKTESDLKSHIESLQKSQAEANMQLANVTNQYKLSIEDKNRLQGRLEASEAKTKTLSNDLEFSQRDLTDALGDNMILQTEVADLKDKIKSKIKGYTKLELIKALFGR